MGCGESRDKASETDSQRLPNSSIKQEEEDPISYVGLNSSGVRYILPEQSQIVLPYHVNYIEELK